MLSEKSDEEIIILYKNGDKGAFRFLVDRYTPLLFNFAAHFIERNNAPDVVQETFIKAWKNINRFKSEKANFKTWLFAIAKNTALDLLRKRKTLNFSDLENEKNDLLFSETIVDENLLPDEALQKLQDSILLNRLLDKLPINYKMILVMHYQEEMTFLEIGQILDKPLNTVKSYHRRALIELRNMMP